MITRGGQPVDVSVLLTRQTLETLIGSLVQRSLDYLDEALRQAKLPKGAIDEVVLVGGSTRIPLVRQRVAEHVGKEPNTHDVNPDEAVALGAAIQASIIDQEDVDDDAYVVMDVTNNDLGVQVMTIINGEPVRGVFSPIIEKNTKLPKTCTDNFTTAVDNQQLIEVKCYQGRSKWVAQNKLIGEPILVENLPPRPAGEVQVAITFSLGLSEMLDVGVKVQDTDISIMQSFNLDRGWNSQEHREKRQAALDSLWQRSEMAGRYRTLIERAEEKLRGTLPEATATDLRTALVQLKEAVAAANEAAAVQADVNVSNILFDLE
jgi:molecular chaperone DnaK